MHYILLAQYIAASIIMGVIGAEDAKKSGYEKIYIVAFAVTAIFWPAAVVAKLASTYFFED